MRAKIERYARLEHFRICASTYSVRRLQHNKTDVRLMQRLGSTKSGGTGADHGNIDIELSILHIVSLRSCSKNTQ